jgi:pyruvate carboxylase
MANELLLLRRGDAQAADRIFDAFAERTGLTAQPVSGGVSYALEGPDHRIKIVEILTDIDSDWPQHVALGQPYGEDS